MNRALLWSTPLRISDALRRPGEENVTPSPPSKAPARASHRSDLGGATAATDILTKLGVVLLSSINAVMWCVYTESRVMGAVWTMIAIVFAVWIRRDVARR